MVMTEEKLRERGLGLTSTPYLDSAERMTDLLGQIWYARLGYLFINGGFTTVRNRSDSIVS